MRKLTAVVALSLVFATLSWAADPKLKNIPRQKYGNGRAVVDVFSQAEIYKSSSSLNDAERLKAMGSLPVIVKTIVRATELIPMSAEDRTTVLLGIVMVNPETDFPGIDQKTKEWMRTARAFSFGSWPIYFNWPDLEKTVFASPNALDVRAGFISLDIVHELSDLTNESEERSFDAMNRQIDHLVAQGVFDATISAYARQVVEKQRERTKALRREGSFALLMPAALKRE